MRAYMTQNSAEQVHFSDSLRRLGALAAEV
jgi:hypothetical protein